MADLIKTPNNRRYVINFQNKEPKNKYDIWLSSNKHELEGNTITDSEYLTDTDLVLKVWSNGKWKPIFGIPLSYEGIINLLKKKINLIPHATDGHIAVIQQGEDECDQLIGMSIYDVLLTLIQEGGAIPLQRATTEILGGIRADIHDTSIMADGFVEAKFKGVEGPTENDRLYISTREIADSLTNLSEGNEMFRNGWGTFVQYNHVWDAHTSTYDDYITISIEYNDNTDRGKYLKAKADGTGIEWVDVTNYIAGLGISFGNDNSINIDTDGASANEVLSWTGSTFDWVPQTSYTVGYGISSDDFTNYGKICGEVTDNSTDIITANTSLNFTTIGARDSILLYVDGNQNENKINLYPYNYYEVNLELNGSAEINFDLEAQLTILKGNPIYILLHVTGKLNYVDVTIYDPDSRPRLININQAVVSGHLNLDYTYFLITIQFGIVKIEPLEEE